MLFESSALNRQVVRFSRILLVATLLLSCSLLVLAQTTVGTGSITGTVTDPQDAVVSGAKVAITNTQTGREISLTTNAAGAFNSGALSPGTYKVQIAAKGFNTVSIPLTVQVGNGAGTIEEAERE